MEDLQNICRICLAGSNLKPFEETFLQNLFTDITGIKIEPQDGLPTNICNNCSKKLDDISLFIDLSTYNNIGFLQTLIKEKEDILSRQQEQIMIIDDGITIKVEQDLGESDCCEQFDESGRNSAISVKMKEMLANRGVIGKQNTEKSADLFQNVCRICLVRKNLRTFQEQEKLIHVFRRITNIVVTSEDELPKNICRDCDEKLKNISLFIELSKSNNTRLQQVLLNYQDSTITVNEPDETAVDEDKAKVKIEINKSDTHPCEKCKDHFSTKRGLMNHMKRVHMSKQTNMNLSGVWKCEICYKDFPTSLSKDKHMECHFGNCFMLCFVCGRAFIQREEYDNHFRIHSVKEKPIYVATTKSNRKKQLSADSSKSDVRKRYFNVNYSLEAEKGRCKGYGVKRTTRKIAEVENGHCRKRPFQCQICLKRYLTKSSLKYHMKIHGYPLFQCRICSKKFIYKFNLVTHMRSHSNERPYHCKICKKSFKHSCGLSKHFAWHRSERPFGCNICQRKFTSKNYLAEHIRVHTGERIYQCKLCSRSFIRSSCLYRHLQGIHKMGELKFQCFLCLKRFPSNYRLQLHMKIHVEEKKFQCTVCLKRFNQEMLLNRHMRTHGSQMESQCDVCGETFLQKHQLTKHLRIHNVARKRQFQCAICGKACFERNDLLKHIRTHKVDKQFKCMVCSKEFRLRIYLTRHMQCHMKREKPHKCQHCSSKFCLPSQLKYHEQSVHSDIVRFKCSFCSKGFYSKSLMLSHARVHTGEKPHACPSCPIRFSHKASLTLHLRVHTGEKAFQCPECQKSFRRKEHLKGHMRTHTGEQPYQCSICSRRFSQKNSLKNHLVIHSGIKNFHCNECSKSFFDRGSLTIHSRIHSGEKPYRCTLCSKSYAYRHALKEHLMCHKGDKPYSCEVCSKSFRRKTDIALHFDRMHRQMEFRCCICSKSFSKIGHLRMHERMASHKGIEVKK